MGNIISGDKSSTEELLNKADSAVDKVTNGQDDLFKKFKDLMQYEMQKHQDDVAALRLAQSDLKDHLSKGDVYSGKAYGRQGHYKEHDGDCEYVKENKKLKGDIAENDKRTRDLKSTHEKLIRDLKSTHEKGIRDLESTHETRIRNLKSTHEKHIRDLESAKEKRIRDLKSENERRMEESERNERDRQRQFEREMTQKTLQIQQLQGQVESLVQQLQRANQRKVSVSLYCGSQAILTEASEELKKMLRCHWEALGIEVTVDQCHDPQTHSAATPLIVLCINASRLGTDVSNAMQHINCEPSVAVVILHHKEYHALPSQPSEKILVGAQYRQIGAIVDIAFLKAKGMYTCDMNERALDKLTRFIENFVRQG